MRKRYLRAIQKYGHIYTILKIPNCHRKQKYFVLKIEKGEVE